MAQRVYLLAVRPDLVEFIASAVAAPEKELDRALHALRERAVPHLRASAAGKRFGRELDENAFERAGRIDDFHLYTGLRPYVITSPDSESARIAVSAARHAEDGSALDRLFRTEIVRVADLTKKGAANHSEEDEKIWTILAKDIRTLRALRTAALAKVPFILPVHKREPFADGIEIVLEETEPARIEGQELAETYGFLLGATLGRVAGLCEPSWWMGRNFWLGLMIAEEFSLKDRLLHRRLITLCDEMTKLASSPGHLFDAIGVEGYEEGFPLGCEGYSSGLIFGSEAVPAMREVMRQRKDDWIALGARASGYAPSIVSQLYDVVYEAFDWAAHEGCSLMEGDELVGSLGYR
jgi:hypothetical protein